MTTHSVTVDITKRFSFYVEAETVEEAEDVLSDQILLEEWDDVVAEYSASPHPYPEIMVNGRFVTGE